MSEKEEHKIICKKVSPSKDGFRALECFNLEYKPKPNKILDLEITTGESEPKAFEEKQAESREVFIEELEKEQAKVIKKEEKKIEREEKKEQKQKLDASSCGYISKNKGNTLKCEAGTSEYSYHYNQKCRGIKEFDPNTPEQEARNHNIRFCLRNTAQIHLATPEEERDYPSSQLGRKKK